jgi:carboxyl-terminal processing protease
MSGSNGCKILVTVLIVAFIMGGLGFVSGFLTHRVLVAAETGGEELSATAPEVAVLPLPEPTATVGEEEAQAPEPTVTVAEEEAELSEPTVVPQPTAVPEPAPTLTIPAPSGTGFDLFWEAWALIQQDYYGDLPTEEELVYGAIRGAMGTLDDPFTAFIEPRVAAINRQDDSGSFDGIGAYVSMEEGRLQIVSTFKGQPAETAGLQRGDIVLQVDDTPIENMSIYEAISLIRGPSGTTVRLTVLRPEREPFEVEIVRASIEIPVVEYEMRPDGLAYVSLFDFSSDASDKLADALRDLLRQNPKGLILDMRGNPGGWLNEAVLTTGLFVPQNTLVLLERFKDETERPYFSPNRPVTTDLDMVVLVDGGSASASEIVAGALQDHGRAVLIGETTFGKGSVQLPHELSNGAELRVTVARWFTPDNRAIHGEGLEPDIAVDVTSDDIDAGLDPQLERAVQYLLSGQ